MDLLTFISDQTIYLLSVALPDANPKQIRLLLLSCVGLIIVLMMFAIMWSMFYEKPEKQYTLSPKAKTPKKAKGPTLARKAGKAAKLANPSGKKAREVSKKAITNKVSAKNKAQPKIKSRVDSAIDETDAMLRSDSTEIQAPEIGDTANGFSFFKRESTGAKTDAELISIEQEMLAIRQLYMDERITKDVYVLETRRLYEKASELRSG